MATCLALVAPIGHLVNNLPLSSVESFRRPIGSTRVPAWRAPNRLSLQGGGVTGSRQRIYQSRLQLTEVSLPPI